ncbi:biotin/lipoate--protein ligase family protein [Marinibacterium profundimaris]|uniref:BPL/LPL catalytic domain-containing protein n=1 Tax=Marinibacterium profundimaris TaxID=1679460 RepID=A0A225NL17_9RHOB|nr:biotin/lipoate--protein ligase family protein [Marinibacterium profundimaris]OWU74767.1 hypothetical protein ATO3_09185 [Marinibacterium profundimaris]
MTLTLPPLLWETEVSSDPAGAAREKARAGCDAGLLCWRVTDETAEAALVLAPEVPLGAAMVMLPLCGVGLQNALGALAPPEVAVHLGWDGALYVNGGRCGGLSASAPADDPAALPGWLVIALSLRLRLDLDAPGEAPDETALSEEGCGEISATLLLEAWARHTLVWLQRWEEDGAAPLHAEWSGLVHGIGTEIRQGPHEGHFLGTDDSFGMLLRDTRTTHLIPLTTLLETRP